MKKSDFKWKCDRCGGSGIREAFLHIDNGTCWKCHGVGTLPYNPQIIGSMVEEHNDLERLEIQKEQEMVVQAEKETFQVLNGFSDDENELLKWKYEL